MKAIVVTDQAAGTAGVKLVERPEPQAAINDVVVQIHASGFTGDELTWPSTWTDRVGRDRTLTLHAKAACHRHDRAISLRTGSLACRVLSFCMRRTATAHLSNGR